jgi:monofunctional biosynthetic peptidoglycan transglycosylase
MRDMREALKSAGERLRLFARFPEDPAAFLRQKSGALKERARQWRMRGNEASGPESAEAAPSFWDRFRRPGAADQGALPETFPSAELPATTSRERLPGLLRILRWVAIAVLIVLALPYALILFYRVIDPPFSALMVRQWFARASIHHRWVDFEDISPALAQAVVISEDATFCRHWGVDWNAVGEALEDAEDGERVRGASTIPMQTAKNLFLWNGQSYLRKILEVPLAYAMSVIWPKRRVLEIYLNIAEWGPGIFGAEAAARHHFGKSAAQLSPREAALLAAALPSPRTRNAGRPNGLTARIAARIGARVGREAQDASCVFARGR